jgi:hypothetical protein
VFCENVETINFLLQQPATSLKIEKKQSGEGKQTKTVTQRIDFYERDAIFLSGCHRLQRKGKLLFKFCSGTVEFSYLFIRI